ncbi:MAG: AAA family ATPase, partial [Nitrososphaerales archaeon]
MSEVAAKEIEAAAKSYASEAIRLDSQGARGMAIQMYQKSISTLVRLAKLYPDYSLNRIYIERASTYQERIKALRSSGGGEEIPGSTDNPLSNADRSGTSTMVAPLNASYDELVLEEKPTVNWSDVVGLDDAKNALRESITFPTIRPDLFPLGWPRGVLLYGP